MTISRPLWGGQSRPARAMVPVMGLVLLTMACSSGGTRSAAVGASTSGDQLNFGTQMAQRGLWSEALFRFRQASRLEPQSGKALGNVAVALEALGRFDEAVTTYEEALRLEPSNADLKRNQSRFLEFFQSYKKGTAGAPATPAAVVPPAAPTTPPGGAR